MSSVAVITGERGAGKSRLCLDLLEKGRRGGLTVGGFISPAVYTDGVKNAFYTMDVRTGEQRLCGERTAENRGTIGCWQMDPAVLEWGNELLRNSAPCDLLFIDELGPLEFDRGGGYTAAFDVLKNGRFGQAYVVVRPACLASFRRLFSEFDVITAERK